MIGFKTFQNRFNYYHLQENEIYFQNLSVELEFFHLLS